MLDKGAPGSFLRPQDQLLDGVFLAFADDLDITVMKVSDPSCNVEALCLPLRVITKVHALNYAVNDYMRPCSHRRKDNLS